MAIDERMLLRVQKLIAHEQSAREIGSVEEAEVFAGKIAELMAKYEIEMADLDLAGQPDNAPIDMELVQYDTGETKRARSAWRELLAAAIARSNYCRILIVPRSNLIYMVGKPDNRKVASFLYLMLSRQIEAEATKAYNTFFYKCREDGAVWQARGYRGTWITGAVAAIRSRLALLETKIAGDAAGKATVLVNAGKAVDLWISQNNGTRTASSLNQTARNGAGYVHGQEWGNSASLSGNGLNGGSTPSRQIGGGR